MADWRLVGHGNVFDVVDTRGSMFHRGAFEASIKQLGSVPFFWEHSPLVNWLTTSDVPIGRTAVLQEDDYGLWYEVALPPTGYTRMMLILAIHGMINASSISWRPGYDYYVEDEIVHITRADLLEISAVIWPGNPLATLKAVKVTGDEDLSAPTLDRIFLEELQAFLAETRSAA